MLSDNRLKKRFACIVGAPRTGTTMLARYMRDHPAIRFSKLKEPHFFSQRDLNGFSDDSLQEIVIREYLDRFFQGPDDDRPVLAEGSVTYLYTPEQMRPIIRLWPEAKFIIGLRDPAEMIPSLHQRLLVTGDESVREFERAWRLNDERKQGRLIPRSCIEPRWLRYDEAGRLGTYVEQFVSVVGRERCLFVIYDELKADPASVCRTLTNFLDVPPHALANPCPKRRRRGFKSALLQRLLMRPPIITRRLLAGKAYGRRTESVSRLNVERSLVWNKIQRTRKWLLTWNEAEALPIELSPALRAEFRRLYREDIARLEQITGRDLGHWLSLTATIS